jgi:molybdenum cofactor synthesis domain-containing protein
MQEKSAGIVVIGNEILSGKVEDTNSAFLAKELRQLGVALKQIAVIPDELEVIAQVVRDFQLRFDVVFTSGGVGPTHDDVTIRGVALALGRRVIRHPLLESKIREYLKDEVNEAHLKMAEVPEGAKLIDDNKLRFPTVKVEEIYILPGIPEILRQKFLSFKDQLAVDPYYLKAIYTREVESTIARYLNATLREFPELLLGSYPKINDPEYKVKLTLESKDKAYVEQAFSHLMGLLPQGWVVKIEG